MQAEAHQAAQGLLQTKDWWYLIATIASPFLAAGLTALLTLYCQHRKEQRDAKLKVFSSLMSVRGNILNFQAAQEWVRSLQLIDVVFADAPDVLEHWHELYLMLQQQEAPPGQGHKMIDLLSAMAAHLDSRLSRKQTLIKHIIREPSPIRLRRLMRRRRSYCAF
jgi:hypothetical protein